MPKQHNPSQIPAQYYTYKTFLPPYGSSTLKTHLKPSSPFTNPSSTQVAASPRKHPASTPRHKTRPAQKGVGTCIGPRHTLETCSASVQHPRVPSTRLNTLYFGTCCSNQTSTDVYAIAGENGVDRFSKGRVEARRGEKGRKEASMEEGGGL